jgi:predicted metal-dependent phosphoesterase TrpH
MTASGRADIHIHTRHSDGRATIRQVLEQAAADPLLDVIAITDHNTIAGAVEAAALAPSYGLEVIVGEEITSRDGHVLGLFLSEAVPPGLSAAETVAAVHAQGGLAVAAHPFAPRTDHVRGVGRVPMGVGKAAQEIDFDGIEVANSFPLFAPANRRARRLQLLGGLAPTGGSDAHVLEAVGKGYTEFPGRTAAELAAAVRNGQTAGRRSVYGPRLVFAYARYIAATYWARVRRPIK